MVKKFNRNTTFLQCIILCLLLLFSNLFANACDGSSISITSGPTNIGSGQYSVTFDFCTADGFCVDNYTQSFGFGVNGATMVSYPATLTSPFIATAVYTANPIGPALGYTDFLFYPNNGFYWALYDPFGGCQSICIPVTIVFNGYPTDLTVIGLEGNGGFGCGGETIVFTPLPIKLALFNASCEGENVKIDWITQAELNNEYFTIERSIDAVNFEEIGVLNGAGNSSILNNYTFVDYESLNGVSYYRLKQTDFNGSYEYFKVVAVKNCFSLDGLNFYPNPVTSDLNISFNPLRENTKMVISIFNVSGKKVMSKNEVLLKGLNNISFNCNDLSKGMYFVQIESNVGVNKTKFIKN